MASLSNTDLPVASLYFSCTFCGQCCHNHSLPLTMEEAISWLEENGTVAIYCEAIRSGNEAADPRTAHRMKRSFPVRCGSSELYVTAILVAVISGACKNLGEDLKCRIYPRRPLVCRIYPAEVSPFIQLDPATKACPAEAWSANKPDDDFSDGRFSKDLPLIANESRQTDYREALRKGLVCRDLGINTTALADEGYVRHLPEPDRFLAVLKRAFVADENELRGGGTWSLFSPSLGNADPPCGLDVIDEKPVTAEYAFLRA